MKFKQLTLVGLTAFALYGCDNSTSIPGSVPADTAYPENTPTEQPNPTVDSTVISFNDLAVHDPSVIKVEETVGEGETATVVDAYYVFGSHLAAARSTDLMNWSYISNPAYVNGDITNPEGNVINVGINFTENPLFTNYPVDLAPAVAYTGGVVGSWASDVIQLADGKYYFYYNHCANPLDGECNSSRSYLGVAVSDSVTGPYTDLGTFLHSGQSDEEMASEEYGVGDLTTYNGFVNPNTIDPDVFFDKNGNLWMVYGSYSGGIFVLAMDETTGMPEPGQGYGTHVAGGDFSAIEGPYMLYSPDSDYYYLFTSFGGFAAADGYNIRVSRSRNPNGPFLDALGQDMVNARGVWESIEPYGVKLMGGFEFESDLGDMYPSRAYQAPGHNSAYYDAETGTYYLITHTRFKDRGEDHSIRVHEMYVNNDGWLVASPHRYVPISGDNIVDPIDLVGTYKFINHERDINRGTKETIYITLNEDRSISGEESGSYQYYDSNPYRIRINLSGVGSYDGVAKWQWDETMGKLVPTFTALSSSGASVWGTQMDALTDAEVTQDIADAIEYNSVQKASSMSLPVRGTRAADISWASTAPGVINPETGEIRRPNVGEGDAAVTLTATITYGDSVLEKAFELTVPERVPLNRVAYFEFENDLSESLGNFASGTATGDRMFADNGVISYAAGQTGQALMLDGTNGVLLPEGLISNYEYTVSFWINPTVITGFTTAFFGTVNELLTAESVPYSNQWLSFLPQSWDGNTMLWSNNNGAWFDGSAGVRINEAEWSHLAFSVRKGLVSVMINGTSLFNAGNVADFFSASTGKFALGVNYWDLPFNGMIDDLKIYDAALSAGEVKALDIDHLPDAELLASAAEILDLGDLSSVREDLSLPITGPYAAAITWSSSDPAVISTDGEVTQPGRDDTDVDVTLTATITLNGEQTTKEFVATVKSLAPADPSALFSFEDDLSDSTGNYASGTINGPLINEAGGTETYVDGAVGKALYLDGSTGVILPNNLINDLTYSVAFWMNPEVTTQFTTAFFGYASDTSWISVTPWGPSGNTMMWSGTAWYDATASSRVAIGTWSHFAATVNNGTVTIYLNGEVAFTGENFPDVFSPAIDPGFTIAINYWDTPYQGMIDELRIYDEAIPVEDVIDLYEQGVPAE